MGQRFDSGHRGVDAVAPGPVGGETFRHVIGHFASGVAVVTGRDDAGVPVGVTASAVASVSLEPPMLLVCLNSRLYTCDVLAETGHFGVNILASGQDALARRFAYDPGDRFAGLRILPGRLGSPLLDAALARLDCRVVSTAEGGTHRVFFAEVVQAAAGEGAPLTYYRGRFGAFEESAGRRASRGA
ncbi:MAG: flavin reductase [Streptosporangiales bacterium]|nr:flavin reductase [Streptosporangiales bacterium]